MSNQIKMNPLAILFHIVLICFPLNDAEVGPIVTLDNGGKIQGRVLSSHNGKKYSAFQEVPYAAPPVGNLRFKDPIEPKSWSEVLQTTKNTKICMQLQNTDPRETEDCLYLNVYTPAKDFQTSASLPVYVFLHGGFLFKGESTFERFGPQFLMDYGIILVTLNYRLGAFGFLSTGDETIPGNYGLKDQNLALQWVQKNIKNFGGDPDKVTLGGQSAGANCVGHQILSEKSKGLFRAAIQESGSPLCSKMFMKYPRYFAVQLAKALDDRITETSSSADILDVVVNVSAKDIKNKSDLPIPDHLRNCVGNIGSTVWNPVLENQEDGFVKGLMHENFKYGMFSRVPVLIGFNSEEEVAYNLVVTRSKAGYMDSNNKYMVNGNLNIKAENILPAGKKLKKLYSDKTFEEDFLALVKFASDAKYTTGICRQIELQSKYADVYMYQFSHDGLLGRINNSVPGVGHAEELNYLFQSWVNSNINEYPPEDLKVQKELLTLWTNFIKYLDPMPTEKWTKASGENLIYMDINNELQLKSNPRYYQKIREIYNEYAEEIQYTY
ncbi:juvenile hormone esterase-like [Diabrotica virgifera virgifera]|uniref:Carboxylic ester hydrolase n=1 Tax=Diabrotica virgifera virgifera TaxID=50390 RepID=A0ABM5KHT6_DIAVI|nr:juvenile hormone esterase-like [Diabrotica virgifera virgifera]XP_050509777.1 juvenile hormone esterase-like [Diabrotica virgifera virgifera]